jgi:flavin-dependent dehydrogenase
MKPDQRKVFDDWVAEQAAKTGGESMRDSFVAMLKAVGAKCKAPKRS